MNKYLRMPPTRERRVNRQRAELMHDMLKALRTVHTYLGTNKLTGSIAYQQVSSAISKAEEAERNGLH